MKDAYGPEDKVCPHCGGNITPHCAGTTAGAVHIIRWCDKCGSNNPKSPPNVTVTIKL